MNQQTIIAVALLAVAAPFGQAHAQTNACMHRVVIDTIYQTGIGGNNYEYFFHIRNATTSGITVDVSFSGFPGNVALFSPSLPGIPMAPYATRRSIKFGRGTNGQISVGTVARVYDSGAGAVPTIRLTNCRPS